MSKHAIRTSLLTLVVGAALLSLPLMGCDKKAEGGDHAPTAEKAHGDKKAAPKISAAAKKAAETKWKQLCVTCHGATGAGDGAAAAAMDPKPRSFSDAKWQASVTDAHIAKVIVEGGPAVKLSPLMPPNPDLKGKPDVVKALVAKVRSFKK